MMESFISSIWIFVVVGTGTYPCIKIDILSPYSLTLLWRRRLCFTESLTRPFAWFWSWWTNLREGETHRICQTHLFSVQMRLRSSQFSCMGMLDAYSIIVHLGYTIPTGAVCTLLPVWSLRSCRSLPISPVGSSVLVDFSRVLRLWPYHHRWS